MDNNENICECGNWIAQERIARGIKTCVVCSKFCLCATIIDGFCSVCGKRDKLFCWLKPIKKRRV